VKGEPLVARLESPGPFREPDHGPCVVALDAFDSRNTGSAVPDRWPVAHVLHRPEVAAQLLDVARGAIGLNKNFRGQRPAV